MCWERRDRFGWSDGDERWGRPPRDRRDDTIAAATRTDVLISDADRHAVIDDLRQHTADGRLTLDEFEGRVDEALRARTGAELHTATRHLPSLRSTAPPPRSGFRLPVGPGVVAACVVVALLVAGHWWVLIPAWFFLFGGCGRHASHAQRRRDERRDEPVTYA